MTHGGQRSLVLEKVRVADWCAFPISGPTLSHPTFIPVSRLTMSDGASQETMRRLRRRTSKKIPQGPKDRGDRPSQDSRTELPTLRGGRPDPPSQPPRPPETTLPGIRHRASHRGGLQRGYRRTGTLVGLGITRFEFGIVGVPKVRRATRTRPTPRQTRGLVTQLRVSRRSHPPSLSRDRMSRLLVVVPTRHESRLKAKNFFIVTRELSLK